MRTLILTLVCIHFILDFFANMPDEAFIELLSSEKTTDPTSWDADFLNTVLGDNAADLPIDDFVNTVESITTGITDIIDPELFAEIGISEMADLTGENVRAAIEQVIENNPELEQQIFDTIGGKIQCIQCILYMYLLLNVPDGRPFWPKNKTVAKNHKLSNYKNDIWKKKFLMFTQNR